MRELCWKPETVRDVINIDADFVPDCVFWAVDSDAMLTFKEGEGESPRDLTTNELVDRFLDSKRGHYQLAVLGPAGTGKSHLIHRIRQRIQGRDGLEILAVRRLETNLRAILEKLIERLPPDRREHYLTELHKAGHTLSTPEVQRGTLLDSLAQAIEEDKRRPSSGIEPELEDALLATLPNMLRDPYLRKEKFLEPGEVIPELVDRLFSNREGKRLEERVLFERANLPSSGITLINCSKQAREAIEIFLYDSDRYIPATLSVINRNLDRAIARALNFSGDQLGFLMNEIRAYLKSQNTELVILFEEFARLQGYDTAMLAALLVQGDQTLCNVRWALACTSGRFRELPDTVRTRMDGIVDMEVAPPRHEIAEFAGRYLNAVRVGRGNLEKAFSEARDAGVPNACRVCPKEASCTESFGVSKEGYSLYPFTDAALNAMGLRTNPEFTTRFNPRSFQKYILRSVLVDEAPALEAGEFPTATLLSRMGNSHFTPEERARLLEKTGTKFDRYHTLFQLWSDGRLQNAPEGVMQSFGLEPISGLDIRKPVISVRPIEKEASTSSQISDKRDPETEQLAAWVEGGYMDQNLAHRLRQALFQAIERAIDWDALGLVPTSFAGATATTARPFRNSSIAFVRQVTSGGVTPPVRIVLPLEQDNQGFTSAAFALEALLKIERTNNWGAISGLAGLAALSELVEACASEVTSQIIRLRGEIKQWDPLAGLVEMLLVGAALGGVLTPALVQSDEGLLEVLFKEIPPESPSTTAELKSIYASLRQKRGQMQELLRAHISVTKGGRAGRFINPQNVLTSARLFRRRKWQLERSPVALSEPYKIVGDLYEATRGKLNRSLLAERDERSRWVNEVEGSLGTNANRQAVLEGVKQALDAAARGGLPGPRGALESARDEFANVQFVAALEAARRIRDADPPESELPSFARAHSRAVEITSNLIRQWENFVDMAEAEVRVRREDSGNVEVERETTRLKSALAELIEELSLLDGSGDGQNDAA
jgi:hypothetical protein